MSRRLPPPLLFLLSICVAACVAPGGGTTGAGGTGGGAAAGTTGGPAGAGGGTGNSAGAMGGTGIAGSGSAGTTGGSVAGGAGTGPAGASGRGGTIGGTGGGAGGGSAGRGGASGGIGGSTGTPVVIPGRGACSPPTGANPADARAAYEKWKTDLLTADGAGGFLRVRRPNSGAVVNSTVSEGIAYGMLLAAYASDRPTFDALWGYSQIHLDTNGLMHWYIGPNGETLGMGAASDSDEDIAFALIMADEVWGSSSGLNYLSLARTMIDRIWQYEVDHTRNDVLTPGPGFGGGAVINISYFAPAFYRAFGRVSGQTANWNRVVATSYDVLERTLTTQNGNASNGLVPAWSTPAGVPMAPPGTSHPIHHQLDSCRTPFRIAQDYCWNAEPRALTYLQKINAFHTTVTVAAMVDGYNLNGTARPEFVMAGGPRAASFVGGAGVGAMATGATHMTLRDQAYANVATLTQLAGSIYYQTSWTALTLQMMTGLMRDLGAP